MTTREDTPRSITDTAAALPAERLEAEIVARAGALARRTYELLVLVGELDARGTWATWGALSCAACLADAADIDLATAMADRAPAGATLDNLTLRCGPHNRHKSAGS